MKRLNVKELKIVKGGNPLVGIMIGGLVYDAIYGFAEGVYDGMPRIGKTKKRK